MSAYSQSSQPSRSAAASASPIGRLALHEHAAGELRAAAAPGSGPTLVTGVPKADSTDANCSAPPPETSIGVRAPQSGTGSISATSAKLAPCGSTAAAIARLTAGADVLRSA